MKPRRSSSKRPNAPEHDLTERAREPFILAAAKFAETRDERFEWGRRGGRRAIWGVFTDYPPDFSNWSSGGKKGDGTERQLTRTKKLIAILDGNGRKHVRDPQRQASYVALSEFWRSLSQLPSLLHSLREYEKDLARRLQHEIAGKLRSKGGAAAPDWAEYWGDPVPPPPAAVARLERLGDREGAMQQLREGIERRPHFISLLHLLRLCEQNGGDEKCLDFFNHFRDHIDLVPDPSLAAAQRYFEARLLSQVGDIEKALRKHQMNENEHPRRPLYAHRSRFEGAQLHFRLENFRESKTKFEDLFQTLQRSPKAPPELYVDVLKFLATFESIHVVFGNPAAEIVLAEVEPGDPLRGLQYANEAILLAEQADFVDGLGWAYAVRAFAHEALGDLPSAEHDYHTATAHHQSPRAHGSSWRYTQAYYAGMLRRAARHGEAKKVLNRVELKLGDRLYGSGKAEVLTQLAMIHEAEGNASQARRCHEEVLRLLAQDIRVRSMSEWGIVRRLRKYCRTYLACSLENLLGKVGA